MEREDDEYIDEEDEAEVGMIDRQKGRRLTNGCSTVSLLIMVFSTRGLHGHDPVGGSGQEVLKNSRVESGRIRMCLKYHGPGRIGSGGLQMPRVGVGSARERL